MAAGELPCCSVKYHQQGHSRKRQLTEKELLLLSLVSSVTWCEVCVNSSLWLKIQHLFPIVP